MDIKYYTVDALWHRSSGENDRCEPTFEAPVAIKIKLESSRKLVRTPTGDQQISESTIFCREMIQTRDLIEIDGTKHPVMQASSDVDLDGRFVQREAAI